MILLRIQFALRLLALAAVTLCPSAWSAIKGRPYPAGWKAKWIWDAGDAKPYHYFLMARRDFTLSSQPTSATLAITAADRYLLYVNGNYCGRGPARSGTFEKSYDQYEIARHMRSGRNTIAI